MLEINPMTNFLKTEFNQDAKYYFDIIAPKFISWDFYQEYIQKEPPFGELGAIVFIRTYSRYIEALARREYWRETVLRNVEYSLSLDTVTPIKDQIKEAEALFDMMFNLRGFGSGRSLWTAGTPQTLRDSSSSWNCCFRVIDSISSFTEIFYWLLIGAGTGFSVEHQYISKLPTFNTGVEIIHEEYNQLPSSAREENTEISWGKNYLYLTREDLIKNEVDYSNLFVDILSDKVTISIGDSKEAWANGLRTFLELITYPQIKTVVFNYDNIRPEGSRIKVFGGRASGHLAIKKLFDNVIKVINRCNGDLDSVGVLDIVNAIGLNVVSGGVRRTAQIALGDANDDQFATAKLNLWTDPDKEEYRSTRGMSNNSLLLYENPGLPRIQEIMESIKSNGEPGFWIIGNSQKLAVSPIKGTNPLSVAA